MRQQTKFTDLNDAGMVIRGTVRKAVANKPHLEKIERQYASENYRHIGLTYLTSMRYVMKYTRATQEELNTYFHLLTDYILESTGGKNFTMVANELYGKDSNKAFDVVNEIVSTTLLGMEDHKHKSKMKTLSGEWALIKSLFDINTFKQVLTISYVDEGRHQLTGRSFLGPHVAKAIMLSAYHDEDRTILRQALLNVALLTKSNRWVTSVAKCGLDVTDYT